MTHEKQDYEYSLWQVLTLPFSEVSWFWALVVAVVLDLSAIAILIDWLIGSNSTNWHEPAILLIVAGGGLLFGSAFVPKALRRAQTSAQDVSDVLEDTSTAPWTTVNHSISEVRWISAIDPAIKRRVVKELRNWTHYWPSWLTFVSTLQEETGTLNFRVCRWLLPRVFLLRVYKTGETNDLTRQDHAVKVLSKKDVFPNTHRFMVGIQPLKQNGTRVNVHGGIFANSNKVTLELRPFAALKAHFNGMNMDELISVAQAYGQMQKAFSDSILDSSDVPLKSDDADFMERTPDELSDIWTKDVQPHLKDRQDQAAREILLVNETFIGKTLDELIGCSLDLTDKMTLSMDVHPHNTLMHDAKCVLIYDYDWFGNWSHRRTLAFSLHRFTREYIRCQSATLGKKMQVKTAQEASEIFINNYINSGPPIDSPDQFRKQLHGWILHCSLSKLISIAHRVAGNQTDPYYRSSTRVEAELRKFIQYTREAMFYPGGNAAQD